MSCCNSNKVNALLNRCSKSNRGNNLVNHFNKRINELENKELDLNNISSNIIPDLDQTYNLGSEEKKFKDLYLSGNTLHLGSIQLKDNGGILEVKDSNGQNALDLDLTTIEEQVNKNSENISILNNDVQNFNKDIVVTNELLVTGNLCYQNKPALYLSINEISSNTVVPIQSSGIYKNIGSSQITLTLDGTSETTTLESGESKLIYTSTTKLFSVQTNIDESEPEILCLTPSSSMKVVNSGGNKYLLNGETIYNANRRYGLNVGMYTITDVPSNHPLAILNADQINNITYSGSSSNKLSKSVDGVEYDFYYGDVTIIVTGNFDEVSLYCYHHGYMGGENLLVFSTTCVSPPESVTEPLELKGIIDFTVPTGGSDGKAIHLYANQYIDNLSNYSYGIGVANNGGGTDGQEYTFPSMSVDAGAHILVCRSKDKMDNYMNASNIFDYVLENNTNEISQNGDDAIELFKDGIVIETFGDINVDGTGQSWEYVDSWAYKDPNGTVSFGSGNWIFGGINVTDGTNNIWEAANVYPFAIGKQNV